MIPQRLSSRRVPRRHQRLPGSQDSQGVTLQILKVAGPQVQQETQGQGNRAKREGIL